MPDAPHVNSSSERDHTTARSALLVRWLWVAVPLAWGVMETVRSSLSFFR